jgi:L-alanine-DL-glutamate epimerase-like enolase superfamily enzyme
MVTPHMPFFEFLPAQLCESRLRKELVTDELVYVGGELPIPARPGLGIELNRDVLEEFARAAAQIRG